MPANIDVEHNGDCGFQSCGAYLIDSHRNGQLASAHAIGNFDDFLKVYKREYPRDISPDAENSQQAFDHLIATFPPQELIRRMAYALRQYAVDRIVKEPQKYPGAFVDNTEGTDPKSMRRPGVWIDGCALTALSTGLKIPIVVIGNTFKANLSTEPSVCKPIELFLSGSHYQPHVEDPAYFTQQQTASFRAAPKAEVQRTDPPLSEILKKIQASEQLDMERENNIKRELAHYSTSDLIAIYREAAKHSDYLPNKILRVTDENNGDLFFSNAIDGKGIDPKKEGLIRENLIHALAKQAYIDPMFDHQILLRHAQNQGSKFKAPRIGQ